MGAKPKEKTMNDTQQTIAGSTVNPEEIANFEAMADEWWDPRGKFKPLHDMNPVRLGYVREKVVAHFDKDEDALRALEGVTLLDMGCGGGLLSEPLSKMGADVLGVDASEVNVNVARTHAEKSGALVSGKLEYRATTAEELAATGAQFDVVCALEIVEHVEDVALFIQSCAALVKPGGLLFLSTINRTAKSMVMAKIGAEYVLRLLPRGTHDWKKFLKPSELHQHCRNAGLNVQHTTGMVLKPRKWEWALDEKDLAVNYVLVGERV